MRTAFAGPYDSGCDDFPPGRAWDMYHRLPVIPRPQWDRFVRTGAFTPGLERHRQETLDCLSKDAVVVDGRTIELDEPLRGVLPPGWYRGPVIGDPPPRPERLPWSPDFELEHLELNLPGRISCPVGSTRDILLPYPIRDVDLPLVQVRADGATVYPQRRVLMGELGSWLLRVCGQGHVLSNTGLGLCYMDRAWLSRLGRAWFDTWDRARASGLISTQDRRFSERVYVWHLWVDKLWGGSHVAPFVAPFALSHMGCPRNHYPHTSGHARAGVAGAPVRYRWRQGGQRPLSPTATEFDVYEEAVLNPYTGSFTFRELVHPYDADGRPWVFQVAELERQWPYDYAGRDKLWRGWTGPPPGRYLVGGTP